MFDYHMHSRVSFDGHATGLQMALAAKKAGLKEICFTDHIDYDPLEQMWSVKQISFSPAFFAARAICRPVAWPSKETRVCMW